MSRFRHILFYLVLAAVPLSSAGGYALVSARKVFLYGQGRKQIAVVRQAMTALNIPIYWQEWHLKTYYELLIEDGSLKRTVPKYAQMLQFDKTTNVAHCAIQNKQHGP